MDKTRDIGRSGEQQALQFLMQRGYELVEQNWRKGRAEIDLIMRDREVLVFVEVKKRKISHSNINPFYLAPTQMRRIIDAAAYYMQDNDWQGDFRFDVVLIIRKQDADIVEHVPDAFRA